MLGAFASLPNASSQHQRLADPADANATVPATRYEALVSAPIVAASAASPADHWKALNRDVGSYDSMSLTMDMDEPEPPKRASAAPPAADAGMKTRPDPHAGHAKPAAPKPDPHSRHRPPELK